MKQNRSLSLHTNIDPIQKASNYNETLNTQSTPRGNKYGTKNLFSYLSSSSASIKKIKAKRINFGQSFMSQTSLNQESTIRKGISVDDLMIRHTVKKSLIKVKKPKVAPEIQKEQAEAIDRLLSYTKLKETKLKKLKEDKEQQEEDMAQKVQLSKFSSNMAVRAYKKKIQSIPKEDPLWVDYQHRDKQVQVDFGDEKSFKDAIKHFKTNKQKPQKQKKSKLENPTGEKQEKEIQTINSYLQQQAEQGESVEENKYGISPLQSKTHIQPIQKVQTTTNLKTQDSGYIPIQERSKIGQKKKQQWLDKQHETARIKEDLSIQQPKRKENSESEVLKDFLSNQDRWVSKKNQFVQQEQIKLNEKGLEGLTFKPQINLKSIEIASKTKTKQSTADRLNEYQEIRKLKLHLLKETFIPAFHPQISPKSKRIKSEYKQDNYSVCSKIQHLDYQESFQDIDGEQQ